MIFKKVRNTELPIQDTASIEQNEHTNSLLKFIAKGGVIIFAGGVIGKILRFIFAIILTRVLGAASYGLYAIGQSIVDIATNIGLLGDGRGLIRFGASFIYEKDTPRLKGVILSYLIVCFSLSIIISASLFYFSEQISSQVFHNLELGGVLRIFAFGFPFYILSLTVIPIGYAFQKLEYKVIIQEVAQPVINTIAIILIFILGGRLYGAVTGFVISSILTAFLGFYLLKNIFPGIIVPSECIFGIKKLLSYSLPVMGVIFFYYLLFRMDRIMLGFYRSIYEVGIYSAVSNTAMFMLVFTGFFETGFTPIISQLYHSHRKEELQKIFNCVTFWGVALAFIPCMIMITFNREVISLFGRDFISGGRVLIILSICFLTDIIPGQLRQLFQMSSHQNIEFFNSFLMIAVNFILNIILIPRLGMIGAAFSVFFSILIISAIRAVELKVLFGFLPFSLRYIKVLFFIVSAIMLTLLFIVDRNIILRISSVLFIVTGFLILIFQIRSEEDIVIWNSIKSKFIKPRLIDKFA